MPEICGDDKGSNVVVRSLLRVNQHGQDFYASVTMDGQIIFDRQLASERSETSEAIHVETARQDPGTPVVTAAERRSEA